MCGSVRRVMGVGKERIVGVTDCMHMTWGIGRDKRGVTEKSGGMTGKHYMSGRVSK